VKALNRSCAIGNGSARPVTNLQTGNERLSMPVTNKASRSIPDLASLMLVTDNLLFVTGVEQSPLLMLLVTGYIKYSFRFKL
jgi:hypothetical protein